MEIELVFVDGIFKMQGWKLSSKIIPCAWCVFQFSTSEKIVVVHPETGINLDNNAKITSLKCRIIDVRTNKYL